MNEFLTFITSGTVERFNSGFKEKAWYFFKIVYYSTAIIFTVGIANELIVYLQTDSIEDTVIGKISDSLEKEALVYNFLFSICFPLYSACTLWYCQTKFNHRKVSLSISFILASITCIIIQILQILPKVAGYNLTAFLFLPLIAIALHLIISNIFSYKIIIKCRDIWNNNLNILTYMYTFLFVLLMLYYTENQLINIIVIIISSSFVALMLIYVRRLLGLRYALALHYILTSPVIIATAYMLITQIQDKA